MGVRFSKEFVGVQFHPEADPISFIENLKNKEKRNKIINLKGKEAYLEMLEKLIDEDTIYKTNETIIPNFLRQAINEVLKFKKTMSN
jgi:GMP synthase-like glutamine amidotransferase